MLTHEAIIDTVWDTGIKPLLVARFPEATPDALRKAHAYAYGGCVIQDMGYYPFGNGFFSGLTHYVRTGDFIMNLIDEARDLNEYAFALGAVGHYAADNIGHPIAVNPSVAMLYPKLARRYGPKVTYEDSPIAHLKTEFGFDVLQVARGNYAPQAYHDFIGFEVSKAVLERAFERTYGLKLKDIFRTEDLALGTCRRGVSKVIPEMTRVAWQTKKDELIKATPGLTRRKFVYNLSRASYRKEWDTEYKEPGIAARFLASIFRLIPKRGPFRALSFEPPTRETERLFMDSFNRTVDADRRLLASVSAGAGKLEDRDFDTGTPTRPGAYRLADDTWAELARRLVHKNPADIDPALRRQILTYFANPNADYATRRHRKKWEATLEALAKLRESGQAEAVPVSERR